MIMTKALFTTTLSNAPENEGTNKYSGQYVEVIRPATERESDVPLVLTRTFDKRDLWVFPDELNPCPDFDFDKIPYADCN